MLFPTFFIIISFYFYPALFNLELSFTDMSFTQLRSGGDWIGLENYFDAIVISGNGLSKPNPKLNKTLLFLQNNLSKN